jgi:O-antigen/teichoic acid export membrane protein
METVATVSESVNALLLWFFIGPSQLALYAFAIAIPTQIVGGLKRIVTIALPKFAERTLTDIKETLVRRLLLLWVGLFILFCMYVVVAPILFQTLFPKYVDAIFYTQLYALTILCFPKKILGTVLNAQGRVRELYIHTLVTPFIKLFLAVWLIPIYGIIGALTAEITSQVCAVLILGTLLIRTRT